MDRHGLRPRDDEGILVISTSLGRINAELNVLGKKCSDMLSFVSGTDIFGKYKQVSDDMVTLRANITSLDRQQEPRTEIWALSEERGHLQNAWKWPR